MINFGHFLCIIQVILYVVTLVYYVRDANKKIIIILQGCWVMTLLLLFIYHFLNGG